MRLDQIAGLAVGHVFGRLLRRALIALAVAAFAIVAICYFTVAGMIALESSYGALQARVIVGVIYAVIAIVFAVVWVMGRGKAAGTGAPALGNRRDMQIVMLVEAAMLGYALARKGSRAAH